MQVQQNFIDIEKAVCSALLQSEDNRRELPSHINVECFTTQQTRLVFSAIHEMMLSGSKIDMITVTDYLRKRGELEAAGDVFGVATLTGFVSLSVNLDEYCAILHQQSLRRNLAIAGQNILQLSADSSLDIADSVSEALKLLEGISQGMNIENGLESIYDISKRTIERYNERKTQRQLGMNTAITTGLSTLDDILNGGYKPGQMIILAGRPGGGKALRMDADILTPTGWVKNADLKIGQEVSSIDGSKSFVEAIYPQGELETYEMTLSDGRKIECCKDHLWEVSSSKFYNGTTKVLTTEQIIDKLSKNRYRNRMSIPLFSGEFGVERDFVVHPYLLGVLLGDGCITRGVMYSKPDEFISSKIKSLLGDAYNVNMLKHDSVSISKKEGKCDIRKELKDLDVLGKLSYEKTIPEIYMTASRKQRVQLINGLMDTDGHMCKNGAVEYSTTSEVMAHQIQSLCWSLGYKCSLHKKQGKIGTELKRMSYRLNVSTNKNELFTLPRKKERFAVRKIKPLVIRSIKKTGNKTECQCITVSGARSLYMTNDYIVTHNTASLLSMAKAAAKDNKHVFIVSLEMDSDSLVDRMVLGESNINAHMFKTARLNSEDENKAAHASISLSGLPICINDNAGLTMAQIKAQAKKLRREGKLDIMYIDYLQLINSSTSNKNYNKNNEVTELSRQTKLLAKELGVPVVILSQLSRAAAAAGEDGAPPSLHHLRDSGSLEQDADVVLFVHRSFYYTKDENERYEGDIIVAKQREGAAGVNIKFSCNANLSSIFDYNANNNNQNPF